MAPMGMWVTVPSCDVIQLPKRDLFSYVVCEEDDHD